MVVLGLTGFVLFAVSAATLAAPEKFLDDIFEHVWYNALDANQRTHIQENLDCCGFRNWTSVANSPDSDDIDCKDFNSFCNTTSLKSVSVVQFCVCAWYYCSKWRSLMLIMYMCTLNIEAWFAIL